MEVKAGFRDPEKVFLSLNRDIPSIEETTKSYVCEHFSGTPLNFPFNTEVSREGPLVIDIRRISIKVIIIINYNLFINTLT